MWPIIIVPLLISLLLVFFERHLPQPSSTPTPRKGLIAQTLVELPGRLVSYVKGIQISYFYWFAIIAGYGTPPGRQVLDRAKERLGYEGENTELYWAASVEADEVGGLSWASQNHFLNMYEMNRNLCNACFLLIPSAIIRMIISAPSQVSMLMIYWGGLLAFVSAVFLVRYFYIYSGYYSKHLLRLAAYRAQPKV